MSTYGLLIISSIPDKGRFVWDGIKTRVFTYEEAMEELLPEERSMYAICRFTPAICRMLRKDPSAKYFGPVIE